MSGADTVTEEVRALERMDLQALRFIWAKHFGDPPKMRSPELMRLMLSLPG